MFLGGLAIRLALLFLDFSFDVNNHIVWGMDAVNHGLRGFYETRSSETFAVLYPNYPPAAIYLFAAVWELYSGLHAFLWWLNTSISFFPSRLMYFSDTRIFIAGLFKLPILS